MKSVTLPSFWSEYEQLSEPVKKAARKTYRLWAENPFHSSLRFKCINSKDGTWAVRVTRNYRALGFLEGDVMTWFWIGNHDDYEQFYS